MDNYENISELKRDCIRLKSGMPIVFSQTKQILRPEYAWVERFNTCYAVANKVVAFVTNNTMYVTPHTTSVENALKTAKFAKKSFYVPFADSSFPVEQLGRWAELMYNAHQVV